MHDKKQKKKKKVWPGGEPEKVQEKLYQKEPQERWKPTSLQNSGQFCAAGFLSLSTVNMWGQIILCCEKLSWMQMGTSSCIHVPSRNNQKRLQAMPNAPRGPNLPGWELLFFITYSKYILKKWWQEYTEELYKKDLHDPDNHKCMITHLEPDILECEVKWALGSITTNKASGDDGIPAELFQPKIRHC